MRGSRLSPSAWTRLSRAFTPVLWIAASALAFTACGQMKDSNSGKSSAGSPGGLGYAQNPAYYAVGLTITANTISATPKATSWAISPALPAGLSFDSTTGTISGTPTQALGESSFTVRASNSAGSTYTTLTLSVVSGPPVVTYSGSPLTFYRGSTITPLSASSSGGAIRGCSISPALPAGLSLSSSTCQISGTPSVLSGSTAYTVTATNAAGNGTTSITIQVIDLAPSISYTTTSYLFTKGTAIASFVPANSGGTIDTCTASSLPAGLSIDASTCRISGTPTAISASTPYTITATNSAASSAKVINIAVQDAAPAISYSGSPYTFFDNVTITTVTPTNSGGTISGCVVWPSLPGGLSLNSLTCAISGKPTAASAAATYTITASNGTGTSQKNIQITVQETPPGLSFAGSPYTFQQDNTITTVTPANSGGVVAACTSVPALPAGLSLASDCSISGTPTAGQLAKSYTITGSNSAGSSAIVISIAVQGTPPNFFYPGTPYIFTQGQTISTVVPTNSGGTITSCSPSAALPAGLNLGPTCNISGTPTAITGTTSYTITGTTATNSTGTAPISITVNDVAPSLSYAGSPYNFNLNTPITTQTPANSGGAITNCTATPLLPTGLSLSTTDCSISGTPTTLSSLTAYSITATNTGGSSSVSISMQVTNSPPVISYFPSTQTFTNGVAIAAWSVTNTGGAIGSCSVSPSLPAGLSLSATTCQITGTPSAVSASATYTVTASNNGGSADTTLTIQVVDAIPVISYTNTPFNFGINSAITNQTPTNTGGVISSCSASPTLPAGLSLSSACVLSGTPTVQQTATNYTITATNTAGSATTNISIAVVNVPSISYPNSPYTFTKGSVITPVSPTNTGSAITSCSYTGTLPTGLSISATDCTLSGTPTALKTATNYAVTPSNAQGSGNTATINIAVVDVPPTLVYSTTDFTFDRNVAITTITPTLGGGAVTSCVSSPSLPTGLSLDPNTCAISGTPSVFAASQNYTITATNTGGSATATLTIQVNDSLPALTYAGSPYNWKINTSVGTITPGNTGGTPTSCAASPTLPSGLTLSNACVITGTPTVKQSATTYTITATNSGGTASVSISIAVVNVPVLSYPSSPYTVAVGIAITPITPTNTGSATTSCSMTAGGPILAGLALDPVTCAITGTPTAAGSGTYTIKGTNSAGNSSTSLTITAVTAPVLSYAITSYSYRLRTSSANITATNAGGAISSCTVSPTLPSGLTINGTTCKITGTPQAVTATTTYTVTATNVAGSSNASISIEVKDLPEIVFHSYTNLNGNWNQTASSSYNVFKITQDGQTLVPLTQNTAGSLDSINPSFNPSTGASVVFSSLTSLVSGTWDGTSPGPYNIWSSNAGGTSFSSLTTNTTASMTSNQGAVVSPDGTKVAFASKMPVSGTASGSYNIFVVNVNGTSLTALTRNTSSGIDSTNPVWSPDSTRIYFQSLQGTTTTTSAWNKGANAAYNIWWVSSDGNTLTRVTNAGNNADCIEPAVSPDGNYLVYASLKNDLSYNIWYISSSAIATNGTQLTKNFWSSLDSLNPKFSNDGTTIIFQSYTDLAGSGTGGSWNGTQTSSYNIWTIVDWSGTPTFTALTGNSGTGLDSITPVYAPDGSKIIFSSKMAVGGSSSQSYNVFIMNTDGTSQTAVTRNTAVGLDSYIAPFNVMYIQP